MRALEIGGYFSLELHRNTHVLHENGQWLNSARNALEYILKNLKDLNCLWIPTYTCEVVMEPIHKLGIPYQLYNINEKLELLNESPLPKGDYLLATNYFGIKDSYMNHLFSCYGTQLIVDNAQAWYFPCPPRAKAIYSPRKYAGLPDGGIAYCPEGTHIDTLEQDCSYERCLHLLKRIDCGTSSAYQDFKTNERLLRNRPMMRMSPLTRELIYSIDFERIKNIRRHNFEHLHQILQTSNLLPIPPADTFACPLVYPYLCTKTKLKEQLIDNKIYVATYWPNILKDYPESSLEWQLSKNIIALPIDQRYNEKDMERIITTIRQCK